MPIIKNPKEVEEIYDWLREKNVCIPLSAQRVSQ